MPSKRALFMVLFSLLVAHNVFAHAGYGRSQPGDGAVIASPPERVDIWFTQELFRRQGENWIRVFDADGSEAHSGEAQIDDDDRAHMWVELKDNLEAGEYRVEWRTLSAEDADTDEGAFSFIVDPQAPMTSTPMAAATATAPPAAEPSLTPTPSATAPVEPPASERTGTGCFVGLIPLIGLAALAGATVGSRKR